MTSRALIPLLTLALLTTLPGRGPKVQDTPNKHRPAFQSARAQLKAIVAKLPEPGPP